MLKSADLAERRRAAVARGVATATPLFVAHAADAEFWDEEGRRYIDFAGGIGVLNVGHRHPRVMAAVQEQLEHFTHTSFQVAAYRPYIELCERLNALSPIEDARSVLFTTGAEAVENAVKIARAATGRPGVIAFSGAFHGRTALTMALTGKVHPYKAAFGAPVPGVWHVPYPVAGKGITTADTLRAIDMLFAADIDPAQVAAIILEPVQGEGGFHVADADLMLALRALCDTHGIQLIIDEVQCGFGRTGRLFAIEHYGVAPDLLVVAKSMAGGLPLSGVIGRAALMNAIEPGGLGGTYGGSPLACAAALAVLDVFAEEDLLARADRMGARIRSALETFAGRTAGVPIGNVRGMGAMIAFDIVEEPTSSVSTPGSAKAIAARAVDEGLVVLTCGTQGESIRILVPLTAPDAIVDEGMAALGRALATG